MQPSARACGYRVPCDSALGVRVGLEKKKTVDPAGTILAQRLRCLPEHAFDAWLEIRVAVFILE